LTALRSFTIRALPDEPGLWLSQIGELEKLV